MWYNAVGYLKVQFISQLKVITLSKKFRENGRRLNPNPKSSSKEISWAHGRRRRHQQHKPFPSPSSSLSSALEWDEGTNLWNISLCYCCHLPVAIWHGYPAIFHWRQTISYHLSLSLSRKERKGPNNVLNRFKNNHKKNSTFFFFSSPNLFYGYVTATVTD